MESMLSINRPLAELRLKGRNRVFSSSKTNQSYKWNWFATIFSKTSGSLATNRYFLSRVRRVILLSRYKGLSICVTIFKLLTKISIRKCLTLSALADRLSLRCEVWAKHYRLAITTVYVNGSDILAFLRIKFAKIIQCELTRSFFSYFKPLIACYLNWWDYHPKQQQAIALPQWR